jgi:hypothetical protein
LPAKAGSEKKFGFVRRNCRTPRCGDCKACRVKILWWSTSRAATKNKTRPCPEKKLKKLKKQKMLTGTLIEDLIATVERVERKSQAETELMAVMEIWFASEPDSASYDNLRGVA